MALTDDPVVAGIDASRRAAWAQKYAIEAERDQLLGRVTQLENEVALWKRRTLAAWWVADTFADLLYLSRWRARRGLRPTRVLLLDRVSDGNDRLMLRREWRRMLSARALARQSR